MNNVFDNMPPVSIPTRSVIAEPKVSTTIKDAIPAAKTTESASDSVEITQQTETTQKKGPIKSVKNFIANIKKTFTSASEYVKGTAKGIGSGAVAASLIYTGGQVIKRFAKPESKLSKIHNKPLAIIAGIGILAANLWTASLNASEKRSQIEHRWTGHNQ